MVLEFNFSILASLGCNHTVFDLQDTKRILLNGTEAQHPMSFYKDPLAIRITEIFEVLLSSKTWPNTSVLHFPAYKIWFIGYLADIGLGDLAIKYCDSISSSVRATQKNTPFMHQTFLYTLRELNDRLQVSGSGPNGDGKKTESGSWFGQIGKLKNNFTGEAIGKGFENFMAAAVGVDDKSVVSVESQTSSLYPLPGTNVDNGIATPLNGNFSMQGTHSPMTPNHNMPATNYNQPMQNLKQNVPKPNVASLQMPRISETTPLVINQNMHYNQSSFMPGNNQNNMSALVSADFGTPFSGNYANQSPATQSNFANSALQHPQPSVDYVAPSANQDSGMDDLGFGNSSLKPKPQPSNVQTPAQPAAAAKTDSSKTESSNSKQG